MLASGEVFTNTVGVPGLVRKEILRFLISGSTNTLVCWIIYLVLNQLLSYTLAYTGAYLFGTLFTYYLNTRWVFKVPMSWRTFLRYPLVYVAQYLLGVSLVWVIVDRFHCPEAFAPLAVVAMTVPVTFLLSRFILRHGIRLPSDKAAANEPPA